jgi:hypothetical protein
MINSDRWFVKPAGLPVGVFGTTGMDANPTKRNGDSSSSATLDFVGHGRICAGEPVKRRQEGKLTRAAGEKGIIANE